MNVFYHTSRLALSGRTKEVSNALRTLAELNPHTYLRDFLAVYQGKADIIAFTVRHVDADFHA